MMEPEPKIETAVSTQESVDETPVVLRSFPLAVSIVIWTYGVVVPIFCHLLTIKDPPQAPEWQSGELSDKLGFVLSGPCGWPMYPLLGFAIYCLSRVMINEGNASKRWIRFGVISGIPVTAWYLFAFGEGVVGAFKLLFAATVGVAIVVGLYLGYRLLLQKYDDKNVNGVVFVSLGLLLAISGIATHGAMFFAPFIISLVFSTPLAFLVYLGMSIRLLRAHRFDRFSIAELLGGMTWLGALLGALRASIMLSIAEYSKLPLEPPEGCYIATAAAKGYPAIVGSQQLPAVAGEPVFVNAQLTTFKTAELALRAVFPFAHRTLRFFYNRIGPRLAAVLGSPVAASLAYLTLKPAEWFCRFGLRMMLGRKTLAKASRLYFDRAKAAALIEVRSARENFMD